MEKELTNWVILFFQLRVKDAYLLPLRQSTMRICVEYLNSAVPKTVTSTLESNTYYR